MPYWFVLIAATESYFGTLAEVEKVWAVDFLLRARSAAQEDWVRATSGRSGVAPNVPRAQLEARFLGRQNNTALNLPGGEGQNN